MTFADGSTENEMLFNSSMNIIGGQYKVPGEAYAFWYTEPECINKVNVSSTGIPDLQLDGDINLYARAVTFVTKTGTEFNNAIPDNMTSVIFTDEEMPDGAEIINVDDLYDKFIHGKAGVPEMVDIAMEAIEILSMYPSQSAPDSLKWLSDWSVVKNRLLLSLCNKNAVEYLNSVIHKDIPGTDLALVPRIFTFNDGESFATLPLSHENLKSYGVSEEELWNQVYASTVKLQPAKIDIAAARHEQTNEIDVTNSIISISSDFGSFGAAACFYDGVLAGIENVIREKFYILPISSRGVLILPEKLANNAEYIGCDGCLDITSFCHDTAVYRIPKSHEDYLTDSAYLYDSGKLSVVNTK